MGLASAQRHHDLGRLANTGGRTAEAARHLRRALRELRDVAPHEQDAARRLHVLVLLALSRPTFDRSGSAAALDVLDDAQRLTDDLDDPSLRPLLASNLAHVLGRSGRLDEALVHLDIVVAHLEEVPVRDRCVALVNRGVARSHGGDLDDAAADLDRAASIAADHGLLRLEFMARHNLGWTSFLRGDLPTALEQMASADEIDVEVSRGVSNLDRGRVLLEAGLLDDAVRQLVSAHDQCRADRQGHEVAESQYELARAHWLAGRDETALSLARQARDRFRRRGADVWAARCQLLLLDATLRDGRRPRTAVATARRIVAAAGDRGDVATAHRALLAAAEAHLLAGEPDEATAAAADAMAVGEGRPLRLSGRLTEARVLAGLDVARGDVVAARRRLRAAARDLTRSVAVLSSLDLRTAVQLHGAPLAAMDVDLARERGAAEVLAASERWRAVAWSVRPVRPRPSPALASALAELRLQRERLRGGDASTATAESVRRLERRAARLARSAPAGDRARGPEVARDRQSREEVVAALMTDGADLVSLIRVREELVGVGIVAGRHRLRRLGPVHEVLELARRVRTDLDVVARHALGPMGAVVEQSVVRGLGALRRRLLDPFALRAERLVVVPTAALFALPWPAVAGGPTTTTPTASAWLRGRTDPDGHRDRAEVRVRVVPGPRLDGAPAETRVVRDAWGLDPAVADVSPGTVADLVDGLAHADVVHVAAHGVHAAENPLFSRVSLGDGDVDLHDLEQGGVGADHVVLSSCDVGDAQIRPGEQPLGLATGILALGAGSVAAACTAVRDELVVGPMSAYHAALAAGTPSDVALADSFLDAPAAVRSFLHVGSPWTRPSAARARPPTRDQT